MSMPRSSDTSVMCASYNLLNMYQHHDIDEQRRYGRVHDVIRALNADVLAVQEIIADGADQAEKTTAAGKRLQDLADATGMSCILPDGRPAIGTGNQRFHVGLLWNHGVEPAGDLTTYAGSNTWHSLVRLPFDVGGRVVQHASYHGPPFGRYRRADEAERVVSIMTRPDRPGKPGDRLPGMISADWNSISADRVWSPGFADDTDAQSDRWVLYDSDPYVTLDHSDRIYQTRWAVAQDGSVRFWADREPGEILYLGGLRDVAPALGARWEATVGHWPDDDPFGERRIDAVRVTEDVVAALRGYAVYSRPATDEGPGAVDPKSASDHLPVCVEYEPAAISPRGEHR